MDWLGLIFPRTCLQCKKVGSYLCLKCLSSVSLANPVCPGCKRFSPFGNTHRQCESETFLDGAVAIWRYEGIVRKAIIKLKYNFVSDIAHELVKRSADDINTSKLFNKSVFLPIPLHKKRSNWRGFNQSEKLAFALSNQLSVPVRNDVLIRISGGVNQATLDRESRLRNMRGKYAVNSAKLSDIGNKRVVLVDDVWTTGSTLNEAARVLKEAGAKSVWGLTIAR